MEPTLIKTITAQSGSDEQQIAHKHASSLDHEKNPNSVLILDRHRSSEEPDKQGAQMNMRHHGATGAQSAVFRHAPESHRKFH